MNSTSGPGSISQTFTTIPGDLYRVSFDLAGDPGGGLPVKTLRVSAAGQSQDFTFDTTGKTTTNMGWVAQNWTFTATAATTTLVFQSLDNGANGPALDNVKVMHPANLVLNGSFEDGPVDPGTIHDLRIRESLRSTAGPWPAMASTISAGPGRPPRALAAWI